MEPAQVTELVKRSGLRGRGGAGFPCGIKWTFLPKNHPGPIYLCVNGDESEPGTFNNRILMEEDPHQLLEGILIAGHAIRAGRLHLPAVRIRAQLPRAAAGDRGVLREQLGGAKRSGQRDEHGHLPAPRRRRLHLRRGDGVDRKPGGQAGVAADQAAVSGGRRLVPQADDREQHRNTGLRDADRGSRRGLVSVDRRSRGPQQPARPGELRAETVLPQRTREPPRLLRIAAGHHGAAAD